MNDSAIAQERPLAAERGDTHSALYQWYVLFVLTFALTVGFVDRQILNLLVEPIKQDLGLSDVRISLLQGAAFTCLFLPLLPIAGRCLDVYSRRNVLTVSITVWSGFTALCGFARNFWGLFAFRSGVGGAEATLSPAIHSMISDVFPNRLLPFAFSIVLTGPYLGGGVALLIGGATLAWAENAQLPGFMPGMAPWQLTFLVASIPGFICAALLAGVREPRRRGDEGNGVMPFSDVRKYLRANRRFYVCFYLGMSLILVSLFAFPAWIPALLMRRFDVPLEDVGVAYGTITLVCGLSGVFSAPLLARLVERLGYADANLRIPALCGVGIAVCCVAMYFATSHFVVLGAAGLASFFYSAPSPVAAAALQIATPRRMRGFVASIYVLVASITGMTFAPTLVAMLTDFVFGDEKMVGTSLSIVCGVAGVTAAALLSRALPGYRASLAGTNTGTGA